jgi:hypothetical protein
MNLRTFNFPPGVSARDLDDQGPDLDEMIEQLNQKADEAYEKAKDAEIADWISEP